MKSTKIRWIYLMVAAFGLVRCGGPIPGDGSDGQAVILLDVDFEKADKANHCLTSEQPELVFQIEIPQVQQRCSCEARLNLTLVHTQTIDRPYWDEGPAGNIQITYADFGPAQQAKGPELVGKVLHGLKDHLFFFLPPTRIEHTYFIDACEDGSDSSPLQIGLELMAGAGGCLDVEIDWDAIPSDCR